MSTMSLETSPNIGLIAGNGRFPILFTEAAKEQGKEVIILGLKGEADPQLEKMTSHFYWVDVGCLGRMFKLFKKHDVHYAAMAGGVKKERFFQVQKIDFTAMRLLAKLLLKRDDELLRTIADQFAMRGIEIVPSTVYLEKALAPEGVLTRRQPNAEQLNDLKYGFKLAKELGKYDIGQAVVVCQGIVLAIEAIEGTDNCLKRGASYAKGDVALIKICKPGQDFRFDLPTVGLKTIENMAASGVTMLGIEAGRSLMLDPDELIRQADKHNMIVMGLTEEMVSEMTITR